MGHDRSEIRATIEAFEGISELYKVQGLPDYETTYYKAESGIANLLHLTEYELHTFLSANESDAGDLLARLLRWLAKFGNASEVVSKLEQLEIEDLQQLSTSVNAGVLKKVLATWLVDQDKDDEEYWQRFFNVNPFVLDLMFSAPVIIMKGKAYAGGNQFDNTGAQFADFLATNDLTRNAIIIEIKKPTTRILQNTEYRNGVYAPSNEMSGAVAQVGNYRQSLIIEHQTLTRASPGAFSVHYPRCLVIAGNGDREIDTDVKKKSFELFRNQLRDIDVVTYDELFNKIAKLVDLLSGADAEDDMPF